MLKILHDLDCRPSAAVSSGVATIRLWSFISQFANSEQVREENKILLKSLQETSAELETFKLEIAELKNENIELKKQRSLTAEGAMDVELMSLREENQMLAKDRDESESNWVERITALQADYDKQHEEKMALEKLVEELSVEKQGLEKILAQMTGAALGHEQERFVWTEKEVRTTDRRKTLSPHIFRLVNMQLHLNLSSLLFSWIILFSES